MVVNSIGTLLGCKYAFLKPSFRQHISALPEIQLVCLLVIAVKLYHPFDGLERSAMSEVEMGVLVIDWNVWCNEFKDKDKDSDFSTAKRLTQESMIQITEQDIFNMSGPHIHDYLDWYEKTWIDGEGKERNKRALPDQLLKMFPTSRLDASSSTEFDVATEAKSNQAAVLERLAKVQNCLKMRTVVSEKSEGKQAKAVRRVGSFYKRYREVEDLPPQARAFYEATAKLSGLSLTTLVKSVFKMELKLQRCREEQIDNEGRSSDTDESTADV